MVRIRVGNRRRAALARARVEADSMATRPRGVTKREWRGRLAAADAMPYVPRGVRTMTGTTGRGQPKKARGNRRGDRVSRADPARPFALRPGREGPSQKRSARVPPKHRSRRTHTAMDSHRPSQRTPRTGRASGALRKGAIQAGRRRT